MCFEMSLLNWITLHRSIHHSLLKHFNFREVNSIETEAGWLGVCMCWSNIAVCALCCIVKIFCCLHTISIVYSAFLIVNILCVKILAHANVVPMLKK